MMFINAGRLAMSIVWLVLIYNLIYPFNKPLNYFLYFTFGFTIFMHSIKLIMLKTTLQPNEPKLSKMQQLRIFLFGVFELFAWQKNQKTIITNVKN